MWVQLGEDNIIKCVPDTNGPPKGNEYHSLGVRLHAIQWHGVTIILIIELNEILT